MLKLHLPALPKDTLFDSLLLKNTQLQVEAGAQREIALLGRLGRAGIGCHSEALFCSSFLKAKGGEKVRPFVQLLYLQGLSEGLNAGQIYSASCWRLKKLMPVSRLLSEEQRLSTDSLTLQRREFSGFLL